MVIASTEQNKAISNFTFTKAAQFGTGNSFAYSRNGKEHDSFLGLINSSFVLLPPKALNHIKCLSL